ncbi:TetR/AcrR family transcriptional regulator [Gordonia amicalis]|uniref:TetR/AcrR family transcriptional regulator n=1 Tax=Gordonia amicalis TaxID=89053 RepID=UPI00042067CA|nr:TetR/AcrR family transcriptional regulator [Gordonia amicalis]UOG20453.1 TetR/AcrR family transcriptional regulator [Gordonia amicalis]
MSTDRAEARDQILDAAARHIEHYGLDRTTIDDIARETGVSRATIYRYFEDRYEIVLSLIGKRARTLIEKIREIIRDEPSYAGKLTVGMIELVDRGRRDPILRSLISSDTALLGTRLLDSSHLATDLTEELWQSVLEEGVAKGEFREDLDITQACAWLSYTEMILVGRLELADVTVPQRRRMLEAHLVPGFTRA